MTASLSLSTSQRPSQRIGRYLARHGAGRIAWAALVSSRRPRSCTPDPAFAWSLRLEVIVSFVGMSVAFLMTTETPEQARAAEAAGIDAPIQGAHSVGVEDGGPGLPLTGWSTTGRDLRVAHFVGLHGLQALPLIGFPLTGFGSGWLLPGHRMALVWTTALSFLGLVVLLTWHALRGQPLIAPDGATLGALLAFAAVEFLFFIGLVSRQGRDQ